MKGTMLVRLHRSFSALTILLNSSSFSAPGLWVSGRESVDLAKLAVRSNQGLLEVRSTRTAKGLQSTDCDRR